MKRIIGLIIAFSAFGFVQLSAQQNYNGALGLRLGYPYGITGKGFISKADAIEGILHFNSQNNYHRYVGLTVLYERHVELSALKGLNLYYGGGAGFVAYSNKYRNTDTYSLGIDGIIGLEYTLDDIPLNFGVDVKPYIGIYPDLGFNENNVQGALSVRYAF